ncbi:MAG: response regulator transcription factor [Candidatus Riflebacteria bacterium]|nr:response regulator transcription factor [Candidatus Riflebacteria bacterium]
MFDDDLELCEILKKYFSSQGYDFHYSTDPVKDLGICNSLNSDLILLDVNFPDTNGFEILKLLRRESEIPVIMLTARGEELDRVLGLELGADDYLSKPFYFRELCARISAVLRRFNKAGSLPENAENKPTICIEDLELNLESMSLKKTGQTIELRTKEFELLKLLMQNCGKVVSKEDLSKSLLDEGFHSIDRRIDVHLSRVRKKIGCRPNGEERILTIRNAGVIFVSPEEKK